MSRSCRTGAYASLQGRADFPSIPDALHLMAHIELQCAHVSAQVFLSAEYQCRAGGYRRNIGHMMRVSCHSENICIAS